MNIKLTIALLFTVALFGFIFRDEVCVINIHDTYYVITYSVISIFIMLSVLALLGMRYLVQLVKARGY